MKKLKASIAAKVAAVILLAVMFSVCVASAAGMLNIESADGYSQSYEGYIKSVLDSVGTNRTYSAINGFITGMTAEELSDGAFCLTVRDEAGNIVDDGVKNREVIWQIRAPIPVSVSTRQEQWSRVTVNGKEDAVITVPGQDTEDTAQTVKYYLSGSILADYENDSTVFRTVKLARMLYDNRYDLIAVCAGSFILGLGCFIFLMLSAGHREGVEGIYMSGCDRIPFDVFTLMCFIIGTVIAGFMSVCLDALPHFPNDINSLALIPFFIGLLALGFLVLWYTMSLAVRIKTRTTVKSCLCYRLLCQCWRLLRQAAFYPAEILKNLSLIKKTVLIIAAVLIAEFLWLLSGPSLDEHVCAWFFERAAIVTVLLYSTVSVQRLRRCAREIADGNLSCKVDTGKMFGPFREHGEDLNSITDGLNKAVAERMKAERFRTELITNVSHDIKTPLTSIINYIDLMEKEEPESEKQREYLAVLSRQSERLKKLIEDLMEASKASTGSLTVEKRPCDLCVLMEQCAGEFGEKLADKGLTLVQDKPREPVTVMADGRHMWRIMENLLNNVCKYSQPGTRVYLSAVQNGKEAVLTVKNISAVMLNVSGEELMERFVRGDSSRSTEGSGLGLNIAQSLARIQGGELEISVDGDLFKATLTFPAV